MTFCYYIDVTIELDGKKSERSIEVSEKTFKKLCFYEATDKKKYLELVNKLLKSVKVKIK